MVERPAGDPAAHPTRSLADVFPRLGLVRGRGPGDVEQVFDALHARNLQHGLLDIRDLKRVVDAASDGHDAALDVEIDLALWQVAIAEDLALDAIAQGQVVR